MGDFGIGPVLRPERLYEDQQHLRCPDCGSFNIEENDPRPGEHTCRDCGGWLDD